MTPKEKAQELFMKFNKEGLATIVPLVDRFERKDIIKKCALIAVNEILSQDVFDYTSDWSNTIEYWQEVKQEINKL